MKYSKLLCLLAILGFLTLGCSEPVDAPPVADGAHDQSHGDHEHGELAKTSLEADLCGKCGCCADCEDCCQGETCDCGMKKGSALCCTGIKPKDAVYCKSCGFEKESESCCSDDNEACDCGMAKGSPLCCKLNKNSGEHGDASHSHTEGEKDGHAENSYDTDSNHDEHQ